MTPEQWDALDARPSVMPWRELRARFVDVAIREFSSWIDPDQPRNLTRSIILDDAS